MIVHDVRQGSLAWQRLRLGKPTASQFGRIFQFSRRQPSISQELYRLELLDEWASGQRDDQFENKWTRRGVDMEPLARFAYWMHTGSRVQETGFITRDDGLCGGSPDGLVGSDIVLEIKAPSPQIHQKILEGKAPGHTAQCQSLLYITERERTHLWIYHPDSDPVLKVIERDDDLIGCMVPVLNQFIEELEEEKRKLAIVYGWAS